MRTLLSKGCSQIVVFVALLCAVLSCAEPAIPERMGEIHVTMSDEQAYELAWPALEKAGLAWKSLRILEVWAEVWPGDFSASTSFTLLSTKGERPMRIWILVSWEGKVSKLKMEPYDEPFDQSQGAPLSEGYALPAPEMSEEQAWKIALATLKPVKPQGLDIEKYELLWRRTDYTDSSFKFHMEPPDGEQLI